MNSSINSNFIFIELIVIIISIIIIIIRITNSSCGLAHPAGAAARGSRRPGAGPRAGAAAPGAPLFFVPCNKPHWEAHRRRVWAGL